MRIIAGEFRSRIILAPAGQVTRPTLDKVREAIFSILYQKVEGANFLDLYAGSGANGLEALSRGAKKAVFIDNAKAAQVTILKNIQQLQLENRCLLLKTTVQNGLSQLSDSFDLVYMDPPYQQQENECILQRLQDQHLLSSSAIVMIEADKKDVYPEVVGELSLFKRKEYGISQILFYRKENV